MSELNKIVKDGLWNNNPGLVQLLGLCPLLAVSASVVNGLGMGIATTLTLLLSNVIVALVRGSIPDEIRLPVFVLIIASVVTAIELYMNAYLHDLYKILGIFIPLIVTNCIIIGRAVAFASKKNVLHSAMDGLFMGLGFTAVLVTLGGIREILGNGTLLNQAHLLFGQGSEWMTITLIPEYRGFILAILPPGAFFALGFIIALKNIIDGKLQAKKAQQISSAPIQT